MAYRSIVYHSETRAIRQMTNSLRVLQPRDSARGFVLLHLGPDLKPLLSKSATHVTIRDGEVVGFVSRGALPNAGVPSYQRDYGPPPPESPSKLAVSSLGDVIMSLPAVEEYSRRFERGITYITDAQMVEFLSRQPFVARAVSGLRARYNRGRILDLQKLGEAVPPADRIPRPMQYAELLGVTLDIAEMPNYQVSTPEEMTWAHTVVAAYTRPIVAMSPFSGHTLKSWGKEKALMASMPDVTFLVLGNKPAQVDLPNVVSVAGNTTVTSMMALVAQCDAAGFLDTGLMHVAGMLGVPYVAVFGGVHPPEEFTSLYPSVTPIGVPDRDSLGAVATSPCNPCYLGRQSDCRGEVHERWCMQGVAVEEVSEALSVALGTKAARPPSPPPGRAVPPTTHEKVTAVAFVNTGGLGDLLVCMNTVRQARKVLEAKFGRVHITFFTRQNYTLLPRFDFVDQWVFGAKGETHRDVLPKIMGSFEVVVNLQYRARVMEPEMLRSIPLFEGHDPGVFIGLNHAETLGDYSYEDDGEYLTESLSGATPNKFERDKLDRICVSKTPYIVIANGTDPTFTQGQTKSIPKDVLSPIIRALAERGYHTVQVGAPGAAFVSGPKAVNAVGETSLEGVVYLLEKSSGVLGADCGIMHVAGQLRVPSGVLFGPTDPVFWSYPDALALTSDNACDIEPCWLRHKNWHMSCVLNLNKGVKDTSAHCMARLEPDVVVEKFERFLNA